MEHLEGVEGADVGIGKHMDDLDMVEGVDVRNHVEHHTSNLETGIYCPYSGNTLYHL